MISVYLHKNFRAIDFWAPDRKYENFHT